MRRRALPLAAALLLLIGVVLAGCGGEGRSSSPLDAVLGYLPTGAGAVFVVETDLNGSQLRTFDRKLAPRLFGNGLGNALRDLVGSRSNLSYDRQVKPLLGNPMVVSFDPRRALTGAGRSDLVAALQVPDVGRVRRLLSHDPHVRRSRQVEGTDVFRRGGWVMALDRDVLVVTRSPERLARALAQRDEQDRLTERRFDRALSGLPRRAFVRGYGGLQPLLGRPELERFQDVNWVAALQSFAFSASFDGRDALQLQLGLNTDPNELSNRDLPVGGGGPPPLTRRRGELAVGSGDQGQTATFLLTAVRTLLPRSRLVRDLRLLERRQGLDLQHDLIDRLDGPTVASVAPGGAFALRTKVSRPVVVARTLRRLAPRAGTLARDVGRLRTGARSLLLLLAPGTPVPPDHSRATHVSVRRVAGEPDLYRITGLRPRGQRLYAGLVSGQFVAASDPGRARSIVTAPASAPSGAGGPLLIRADGPRLGRLIARTFGFRGPPPGRALAWLSGARGGVRARLSLQLP